MRSSLINTHIVITTLRQWQRIIRDAETLANFAKISHMRLKIGFRTWIKVSLQYLILIPTLVYSVGVFRFPAFYNLRYEKWRSLKMQSNLQTIVNKLTSTNTLSRNQQRSIAHTRSNAWSKTFAIALSLVSVNLNFTRWSANRNELYIN